MSPRTGIHEHSFDRRSKTVSRDWQPANSIPLPMVFFFTNNGDLFHLPYHITVQAPDICHDPPYICCNYTQTHSPLTNERYASRYSHGYSFRLPRDETFPYNNMGTKLKDAASFQKQQYLV